jgi:hypothetical protein
MSNEPEDISRMEINRESNENGDTWGKSALMNYRRNNKRKKKLKKVQGSSVLVHYAIEFPLTIFIVKNQLEQLLYKTRAIDQSPFPIHTQTHKG